MKKIEYHRPPSSAQRRRAGAWISAGSFLSHMAGVYALLLVCYALLRLGFIICAVASEEAKE